MDALTELQQSFEEFDAQVKAATPPAGWTLIPRQPTQEMLLALMSEGEKNAMKGFPLQYVDRFLTSAQIPNRYLQLLAVAPVPAPVPQGPMALPFAILPDEMAALRRFHECSQDGDEYDVPKPMMKRLAEIGLVRRVTSSIYEYTTFGLSVLIGEFSDSPDYANVARAAEMSRQYAQTLEDSRSLMTKMYLAASHRAQYAAEHAQALANALEEVFVIGDRLVSDVYGGEFVEKTRQAMSTYRASQELEEVATLWSIHIPGPDEYHAAPSEHAARHMAKLHNEAMNRHIAKHPLTEFSPPLESITAQAVPWPFDAESHAEEIAAFDYAGWGLTKGGA